MPIARILLIILRLFGIGVILRGIEAIRAHLAARRPLPRFPPELLGTGERSWIVFIDGKGDVASDRVLERIRSLDPEAALNTVDLRRELVLARAFRVRGAPSVFLAGPDGSVRARLGDGTGLGSYVSRGA